MTSRKLFCRRSCSPRRCSQEYGFWNQTKASLRIIAVSYSHMSSCYPSLSRFSTWLLVALHLHFRFSSLYHRILGLLTLYNVPFVQCQPCVYHIRVLEQYFVAVPYQTSSLVFQDVNRVLFSPPKLFMYFSTHDCSDFCKINILWLHLLEANSDIIMP